MRFVLPWPPKELSPNSRTHWRARAAAIRKYRHQVAYLVLSQPREPLNSSNGKLLVALTFHPKDKRHRDLDNCLAAFKAGLDGIADALQINDRRFGLSLEMGDIVRGGEVEVMV